MFDPDPWGEDSVVWGSNRRYGFLFETLSITSIFKNHDQGNVSTRLIPTFEIFKRKGKFLPNSQKPCVMRILLSSAKRPLDFGEINFCSP